MALARTLRRWSHRTLSSSGSERRAPRWGFTLLLLGCAAPALAALPPSFTAHYEVSHSSGITLGEATVHYERVGDDHYRYGSTTKPVGIAALILDSEIEEHSEGRITAEGFKPDRYVYERRGKKAREAALVFDWKDMKVVNAVSGSPSWELEIPPDALDRMVSQLQLMHDLAAHEKDLSYPVADGGKLRQFDMQILGREKVETPYGMLDAVKITRKEESDKRATFFWCAPALNYLPVRIDHREKGDNFTMRLEKLEGMEVRKTEPKSASGQVPTAGLVTN